MYGGTLLSGRTEKRTLPILKKARTAHRPLTVID